MIISNADGKIWLALKSRISQWTETPVMLPESNYEPEATDSYIIVQHVGLEYGGLLPVNINCGQPLAGILNISVMVPTDFGYDSHIGRAGRVADHFMNGSVYKYSDLYVRINGRSRVIGNAELQTPWNRLEVQVPWIAWG